MPIPCPFLDTYQGSGETDPHKQLADLFDHIADKHCEDEDLAAKLREIASKMRNPTRTPRKDSPDLNRIDDHSQYVK